MNKKEDKLLAKLLRDELQQLSLSEQQQEQFKQTIFQALNERQPWWRRTVKYIKDFLETTYEISLVPVIGSIGIFILAGGFLISSPPEQPAKTTDTAAYYLQQTTMDSEGNLQLVYVAVKED